MRADVAREKALEVTPRGANADTVGEHARNTAESMAVIFIILVDSRGGEKDSSS